MAVNVIILSHFVEEITRWHLFFQYDAYLLTDFAFFLKKKTRCAVTYVTEWRHKTLTDLPNCLPTHLQNYPPIRLLNPLTTYSSTHSTTYQPVHLPSYTVSWPPVTSQPSGLENRDFLCMP